MLKDIGASTSSSVTLNVVLTTKNLTNYREKIRGAERAGPDSGSVHRETEAENEAGKTEEVCARQIERY